jgi:hypothetical protein
MRFQEFKFRAGNPVPCSVINVSMTMMAPRATTAAPRMTPAAPRVTPTDNLAGVAARLAELTAQQAALLAEVRRLAGLLEHRHATVLHAPDVRLLDAIASHIGEGVAFSAAELWRHAERVDDALRGAILAAGLQDTRALGRRLQRIGRRASGLVRLSCVGRDGDGKLWCVTVDRHD